MCPFRAVESTSHERYEGRGTDKKTKTNFLIAESILIQLQSMTRVEEVSLAMVFVCDLDTIPSPRPQSQIIPPSWEYSMILLTAKILDRFFAGPMRLKSILVKDLCEPDNNRPGGVARGVLDGCHIRHLAL